MMGNFLPEFLSWMGVQFDLATSLAREGFNAGTDVLPARRRLKVFLLIQEP